MTTQDIELQLTHANEALDDGDPKKALGAYDRILTALPTLTEAVIGKARALIGLGHVDNAIALLNSIELTSAGSNAWLVQLAYGEVAAARRDWARAEQQFRNVLEKRSGSVTAIAGISDSLCMRGSAKVAEAVVREALLVQSQEPMLWGSLATSLSYQGRHFDALRESAAGLRIAPSRICALVCVQKLIRVLRLPVLILGAMCVLSLAFPPGWFTILLMLLFALQWILSVVAMGLLQRKWGKALFGLVTLPLVTLLLVR